jgi:hypothetical protein
MTTINATEETLRAVAETLKLAALLDDRVAQPDKARIAAWAEQVQRHNLSREDLLTGLQAFYDGPSDHAITIGDLIHQARHAKRDRTERESDEEREARQARMDARMVQTVAELAEAKSIPDDEPKFKRPGPDSPLRVPCPHPPCAAGVGQRCMSCGRPLRMVPRFHASRIDAARAAKASA